MNVKPSEIQLKGGKFFDYLDMKPDSIEIMDIAHALSMQCRFNGHVDHFYSVAQHSVLVSMYVPPEHAMVGLMHDATEAYIGDMASPLKQLIPQFREVEDQVWQIIAEKFKLPGTLPQSVKEIDKRACLSEAMDLMGVGAKDWNWDCAPLDCGTIFPLCPAVAKELFISRWHDLLVQAA